MTFRLYTFKNHLDAAGENIYLNTFLCPIQHALASAITIEFFPHNFMTFGMDRGFYFWLHQVDLTRDQ